MKNRLSNRGLVLGSMLFSLVPAHPACAHGLLGIVDSTSGITATAGASSSGNFGSGWGAEIDGSWFVFNGALATTKYNSPGAFNRSYLGVGIGQVFQVQCGFGTGTPSLRLRGVTSLFHPFTAFQFEIPKKLIPVLSGAVEFSGPQGTTISVQIGAAW